ncbi:DUF2807 domain-containing protein [Massilia arenosa]|uniref:DUF2807 domain-containing protein n=1 Tax=Zemynaea arenosa TaxID=2561931 RepID=A0A4Y9ST14_9BURK|nr:head GIN domain-containing protein [Massilia arenosa]TFW29830.1 DUF2807 domain-containing protein [Massilia arenosa]
MRALLKLGFGLLVLAFFLIGAAYSALKTHGTMEPATRESREVVTDARNVGKDVKSVQLDGPIELYVRQGAVPSLVVKAERRLLGNVDTLVEGEHIRIGTSGMLLHHRQPIRVELVLPELDNMVLNGSGDSKIDGFSGENLQIEMNGSGEVKFTGRYKELIAANHSSGEIYVDMDKAERLIAQLNGSGSITLAGSTREMHADLSSSGQIDAEHMTAETASADLRGSGSISVHASQTAIATVRGSGSVSVYGNPQNRTITKTGSGDVSFP